MELLSLTPIIWRDIRDGRSEQMCVEDRFEEGALPN